MRRNSNDGKVYAISGIVSAVISLIFFPLLFGILAVILGITAINKNEKKLGILAVILGIVLAIISWTISFFILFVN